MFRAKVLQSYFWPSRHLVVLYLNCLHWLTLCFAGREQNGATHNDGEPEGDSGLTSPVPHQRTKLAPPSISPPSIPLSSPTSRKPVNPRPALRSLDDVRIQDGQRSDAMVATNGESGVTVNRAQSFQGSRPQLKRATGKQEIQMTSLSTILCDMNEGNVFFNLSINLFKNIYIDLNTHYHISIITILY